MRCGANLRYEMLSEWIRMNTHDLADAVVLEFDPDSPLRPLLAGAGLYIRSYFDDSPGAPNERGGAVNEDIQRLSLPDSSVDLIVSSEVLEHVPDLGAAFAETRRVLRPGGAHVFTVPPRERTLQRAKLLPDGSVKHLVDEPEYHADPLRSEGILCYWDLGTADGGEQFSRPGLRLEIAVGPAGRDGRVVWVARRE
jgi:SAM-dependent methyltransferase